MNARKGMALAAALAAVLALAGCSGQKGKDAALELTDQYGDGYPIQTDNTLSVFCEFPQNALKGATTLNDLPLGQQVEKETGVHIDYIHPSDTSGESFNLMLASGDLPDIIMYRWCQYAGGGDKAVTDGYIYELNDIVDKYSPDFKAAMERFDATKYYSTDDGKLFFYPGLWDTRSINTSGFMIRKDWLDDLGLEVPETMDEWETMLRAFRDQKGATAPFTGTNQVFSEAGFTGAYGFKTAYYVKDNQVMNGFYEPVYKDFLERMVGWHNEGILDPNFTTTSDGGTLITNMLTGKSGATFAAQGSVMGPIMAAAPEGYELVPAPFPTMNKGEKCNIAMKNTQSVAQMGGAITTQCKDVELAARWLNYGYTEQGHLTYAFGVEGESYEMVDGEPTFTDLVMNNPEGIGVKDMLDRYTRSATSSHSMIKAYGYLQQYAKLPCQKAALEVWSDQEGPGTELPPLFFTDDEKSVMSQKQNALQTYQLESFYQFIDGRNSLDNFDSYMATMKDMGAQDVLDAYQQAYDRYLNR